jgi:hypothetical protein
MQYKGQTLAPLHKIIRRLICIPFVYFFAYLSTLFVLLGWGEDAAIDFWESLNL